MRRWLWLGWLILLAACSPEKDNLVETPRLQAYTPERIAGFAAAIHPAIIQAPADPSLPALIIENMDCTENVPQGIVCLGWLANPTPQAYQNITLQLALLNAENTVLEQMNGTLARDWLPPQSGAPFRILVPTIPDESVTPTLQLTGAEAVAVTNPLAMLTVQNLQTRYEANLMTVSGEIFNPTEGRIQPISLVITARADDGAVLGFRVLAVEQLASQTSTAFLTTVPASPDARLEVTADGYRR